MIKNEILVHLEKSGVPFTKRDSTLLAQPGLMGPFLVVLEIIPDQPTKFQLVQNFFPQTPFFELQRPD